MAGIRIATLLAAYVAAAPSASHGISSFGPTPAETLYTDGTVLAVAAAPDKAYIGGNFTLIGRPTGSWVAVDPGGTPIPRRPEVVGSVSAAVRDGRGGWFVAGAIQAVGNVGRAAKVVHLRPDGSLDERWRVTVRGGPVNALAVRGQTLFVGGGFVSLGGKPRRALAAVSSNSGRVLPWRLNGAPQIIVKRNRFQAGAITTLAPSTDGRTLYMAGSFGRVGGRRRAGLASVDVSTGHIASWDPRPNGEVGTIVPGPGGRVVYLAGSFGKIGGTARNAVAAVDARRGKSVAFNAHISPYDQVFGLVATPSAVYVAGDFTSLGGKSRHLLAALDPRTGGVSDWEPTLSGDSVKSLAIDPRGTTVYVGGELSEVGGQRRDRLAAIDARTGAVTGWDPPTLGEISVLATDGKGTVFVGGEIEFVGGARRPGLASLAADGSLSDWTPALDGIVRSLAVSPDKARLYVGGAFTPMDAPAQKNLAVVNVATGQLSAFGGGTNSGVWALAPTGDGSRLYIGGAFVTVAGTRRQRLAALDAGTGSLLSWNAGTNDLVRVLLATEDGLYVGGDFSSAGGLSRSRLVKLDAETGRALGWNPAPDDNVWALALHGGTLYVGGEFKQIGGKSRNALVAVDVESGEATPWDPSPDGTVRALRLSPDGLRLFAGGEFEKIGGAPRGYADFSVTDGSLSPWNPGAAFDGYSIDVGPAGAPLIIGGDRGADIFR